MTDQELDELDKSSAYEEVSGADLAAAVAEVRRLRTALKQFGQHLGDEDDFSSANCRMTTDWDESQRARVVVQECTCGLDEALGIRRPPGTVLFRIPKGGVLTTEPLGEYP